MKDEKAIKVRMGELLESLSNLESTVEGNMIRQQILGALDFASWVLNETSAKSVIDTELGK